MTTRRNPDTSAVIAALSAIWPGEGGKVALDELYRQVRSLGSAMDRERFAAIVADFEAGGLIGYGRVRYLNSAAIEVDGHQVIDWVVPDLLED
jgi:Ca2+-binding EF-hand superfamily protein